MTIAEIKKEMTDAFISDSEIKQQYGLQDGLSFEQQFSIISIESIIFYIVATIHWVTRNLFEQHKTDVRNLLNEQKSGTANWYAYMAKRFQYGMSLVFGTDHYDNSGLTGDQVAAMQVVRYAAAVESKDKSILYLKIATGDTDRQPISAPQLAAFKQYVNDVQYAGVRISVINDPADEIRLTIDIYYDPLILDETGKRLDGTGNTPVKDAIVSFLNNLPFNGTYSNQSLVDALQAIPGVNIAEIKSASSRYGAYINFTEINAREIAHAGYYRIADANLTLQYIPDEEVL